MVRDGSTATRKSQLTVAKRNENALICRAMNTAQGISVLLRRLVDGGKTQKSIADDLDVSPTAINEWLHGRRIPDPPYIWRIANLAHMDIDEAMRLAGHLPALEDVPDAPELPAWVSSIPRLAPLEQEIVRRQVEGFLARPLPPGESLGPARSL